MKIWNIAGLFRLDLISPEEELVYQMRSSWPLIAGLTVLVLALVAAAILLILRAHRKSKARKKPDESLQAKDGKEDGRKP